MALSVLCWVLEDGRRGERLLGLTGLTPDVLRAGLGDPSMLRAVIEFVANHEPDLLAAAEDLGVEPQHLVAASRRLAQ